jgi:DNA-binding NtrC family response regulator
MPWPALILGETGTGKELVARSIHDQSAQARHPFVAVNCGAIPESLAESTLFGHEKGAFTGADRKRSGVVERVGEGTLFLDEVGELPAPIQVKLLRLLQERTFERVGGDRELPFRGRIVAATHRQVDRSDERGGFREDLYHRLGACVLRVPPLADRRADIPALAEHLLQRALQELTGSFSLTLASETLVTFRRRDWPGNVRELENAVRASLAHAIARGEAVVRPEHLMPGPEGVDGSSEAGLPPLPVDLAEATDAYQRRLVEAALDEAGGHRTRAAELLGVSRQWLHRLTSRWKDEG